MEKTQNKENIPGVEEGDKGSTPFEYIAMCEIVKSYH